MFLKPSEISTILKSVETLKTKKDDLRRIRKKKSGRREEREIRLSRNLISAEHLMHAKEKSSPYPPSPQN